jgi:hypothetical protein
VLAACSSGGGSAASVKRPPTGAGFDYQLGGDGPVPAGAQVVVRDWQEGTPPGGAVYAVCYVNAFQSQPGVDWPAEVVSAQEDPDWPGEFAFDLSTPAKRAAAASATAVMINTCAGKGFDAVEFDNLDTFTRYDNLGFGQTAAAEYATTLVQAAHAAGLAAAQKNTVELLGTPIGFDFALVEECGEFDECGEYTAVYSAVFDVEYSTEGFVAACAFFGNTPNVILRDLDLLPEGEPGHVREICPSPLATG